MDIDSKEIQEFTNLEGLTDSINSLSTEESLQLSPFPELRQRFLSPPSKSQAEDEIAIRALAQKAVEFLGPLSPDEELCGNKHLNLIKMGRIVNRLGLQNLKIPMPQSLSTEQIKTFWQQKKPIILTSWEELKNLHAEYQEAAPFLENPKAKKLLETIQNSIAEVFSEEEESVPLPEEWLEEQKDSFLMVRSSGAEDSSKTANAGGNASIPYVPAQDRQAVCSAIGVVLQSYFGEASLQNRLNAGLNPFEEDLSLGVVLQELIGEPIGGAQNPKDIPVSFVLFTNEPLFIGDEPFRVMQISATYGHGEAVVGEEGISTDTIYILSSAKDPEKLYILSTNQEKRDRLAPQSINPVTLKTIANPEELIYTPSLSSEILLNLYRDALLIEGIFDGTPTDIEGIVKNGVVHFVQARPIQREPMLPTHLQSTQGVEKTVYAETIVPANASVITISDPKEILYAHTLLEAESQYSSTNPPKLIIVTSRPSATSHPVVNFRWLNVPCLCLPDVAARDLILSQIDATHPLAVCMQTATLNLWNTEKEDLVDAIAPGFSVHPATLAPSIPILKPLVLSPHTYDMTSMQAMLREGNWEGIAEQIKTLEEEIDTLKTIPQTSPEIEQRISVLSAFIAYLSETLEEVQAAEKDTTLKLRFLFYRKALETMLLGSSSPIQAVGQYSFFEMQTILQDTKSLLAYTQKLTYPAKLLHLLPLGFFAHSDWEPFLLSLEEEIHQGNATALQVEQWSHFIQQIHTQGAFPFWLTFFKPQGSFFSPKVTFQTLLQQCPPAILPLITSISEMQTKFKTIQRTLGRFANPESFDAAWKELVTELQPLTQPTWISSIQNSRSPVVKMVGYKMMEEAVETLDQAIKTFKGNHQLSDQPIDQFKMMLQQSYDLVEPWINSLQTQHALLQPTDCTVTSYLYDLANHIQNPQNSSLSTTFLPSQNFSVSAAVLGAQTAWSRHRPETLEDVFTLLHQNSLVALNLMNQNLLTPRIISSSLLPTPVKIAMQQIENSWTFRTTQRLGLQVKESTIILTYNVPLQNHSGKLEVHYDVLTEKLSLKGKFLGQARTRWDEIKDWVTILNAGKILNLEEPPHKTELEISFAWNLPITDLSTALEAFNDLCDQTFGNGWGTIPQFWNRWSNHPNRHQMWVEAIPTFMSSYLHLTSPAYDLRYLNFLNALEGNSYIWQLDKQTLNQQANTLSFFSRVLRNPSTANFINAEKLVPLMEQGMKNPSAQWNTLSLIQDFVQSHQNREEARFLLNTYAQSTDSWIQSRVQNLLNILSVSASLPIVPVVPIIPMAPASIVNAFQINKTKILHIALAIAAVTFFTFSSFRNRSILRLN